MTKRSAGLALSRSSIVDEPEGANVKCRRQQAKNDVKDAGREQEPGSVVVRTRGRRNSAKDACDDNSSPDGELKQPRVRLMAGHRSILPPTLSKYESDRRSRRINIKSIRLIQVPIRQHNI